MEHHRPDEIAELRARIARKEARLAELDADRAATQRVLKDLRARLAGVASTVRESTSAPAAPSAMSPTEKLVLFRSLFAGRADVYPKFWENSETGRKGYSPACGNEWEQGICEKKLRKKSRAKCGECPNQAFLPVTDHVLVDHLQGRHVVGVYPLLPDETCRFLALDFDKDGWREDVAAFAATCRSFDLPVAVERSRSGNGAHAWFFFSGPVPAATARKMGCWLLTETMSRRPELSMSSYDRLFPNQDTMPRGGFGNLIALPLQLDARRFGNTVFLDDDLEPRADQWGYLSKLPRLDAAGVDALARRADEAGRVLAVGPVDDAEAAAPWLRTPSRRLREEMVSGPLPSRVHAVLEQQLFIAKEGLSPALVNRIQRLAAFPNPEFHKRQAMRLSTGLTPRVVSCAENLPAHVGLPRGCLGALEDLLRAHDIEFSLEDRRTEGEPLDVEFHGELTAEQAEACRSLLGHDAGVFVAPPGTGKTVVGIGVVARRARSTLVIVHKTPLLDQWRARLALFLDIEAKEIGQIGGGKWRATGRLDVAMLQSLVRRDRVEDLVADYGHVVVDECHHVPAVSFERVMRELRARYVTGLTATPRRRDGHDPILRYQIGPVRYAVDPRGLAAVRSFEHRLIVRETGFALASAEAPGIQELYGMLANDADRNELILDDVVQALEERRSPLLLTERREHLDLFAERLGRVARHLVVLHGGMSPKRRREIAARLAEIPDGEERLLLATGRFIGEGFDDARLDTLFLALPVAWRGTLVQYAGRLHRKHQGKEEVRVYDYVDRAVPVLARMFEKRRQGYRSMGYRIADSPASDEPAVKDCVVEYDEQVLRELDDLGR